MSFTPPNYIKRADGGPVLYNDSGFSVSGEPLHVSYPNYWLPIATFIRESFVKLGFKAISGFNTGSLIGYAEFTSTIDPQAQTRSSSETAFLQKSIETSSLEVYQQTLARKILFDDENNAVGVSVSTAGVSYVLSAREEVIVSAGVVCYYILRTDYRHICL